MERTVVGKGFLTQIDNIHFFANVLEGLFREYQSSSVALGNVLSSQSQLSRVLTGLLAYQVVVCRVQCWTSSGLLSTNFNTLCISRGLAVNLRFFPNRVGGKRVEGY